MTSNSTYDTRQAARLVIGPRVFREMLDAAVRAAPVEACGLLAGHGRRVTKCYHLTNADASPTHFSMVPDEQFAAVKDMRKNGAGLLAIWHSHPETPARMSEEDIRLAYTPDTGYVILSLAGPEPVARCFRMIDGEPVETPVVTEGDGERK